MLQSLFNLVCPLSYRVQPKQDFYPWSHSNPLTDRSVFSVRDRFCNIPSATTNSLRHPLQDRLNMILCGAGSLLQESSLMESQNSSILQLQNSRITELHAVLSFTESLRTEKPLRFSSSTLNAALPSPPLNHVLKCHIYTSFNTSRDGDSTSALGSLFLCLTSLSVKKFLLTFSLNLPCHNLRLCLLVLLPVAWKKRLTPI